MKNCFSKIISLVLVTTLLLTAAACSAKNTGFQKIADIMNGSVSKATASYKATLTAQKISPFSDAFATGINHYGWTAASLLYDGGNLAISPASLELAILMTRTGALGATAEEMKTALSMSSLSDEEILSSCKQLMWRANTNGMTASNSIWLQDSYTFNEPFIKSCTDNFMADAFLVDFQNDAAGATNSINKWASDKTNGKIPEMNPDPLDPYTRLVLVNALYYLGDWEIPFEAEKTYDQVFHGSQKDATVKFMHSKREMLYSETPSYQMISLPFTGATAQSGSPYSMAFIVPGEGRDVTSVMKDLAANGFTTAAAGLAGTKVKLALPKFEFTFDTSMLKTMQTLGMNHAFDPAPGQAEFEGITASDDTLCISDILHKCYIRVDEKGAEAAAVTEPIMSSASASLDDGEKIFTADRPFLFAIYDETDSTILFLGIVGQL